MSPRTTHFRGLDKSPVSGPGRGPPSCNMSTNAGDIRDAGLIPESEDPLEEEMATHSNILAWRIPWTEEPGGLWPIGSQRDTTEVT